MNNQSRNSFIVISSSNLPAFLACTGFYLTAAIIPGDSPIKWIDGKLIGKKRNGEEGILQKPAYQLGERK